MSKLQENLENLYNIQMVDLEIIQSLREIKRLEITKTDIQKQYMEISDKVKELETKTKPNHEEIKKLQDEIAVNTEKKKICEDKLFSTEATPKELGFLQKEREQITFLIKKSGDQIIKLKIELDNLEIKLSDLKEQTASIESQFMQEQQEKAKKIEQLRKNIENHKGNRKNFKKISDSNLLLLYKTIQKEADGIAIATILEESICEGCLIEVSASIFYQLENYDDNIVRCQNCGRILFLKNKTS